MNRGISSKTVAGATAGTYAMGHSAGRALGQAPAAAKRVAKCPSRAGASKSSTCTVLRRCRRWREVIKGTPLAKNARAGREPGLRAGAPAVDGSAGHRHPGAEHQRLLVVRGQDRDLAGRIVKAQNEGLAKFVSMHPDRFVAMASTSLQFPDLAAQQLEDGVKRLGLRGAAIGGHVNGEDLSQPKFDPFWAKAAELGVLVFMHPGGADNIIKDGALEGPRRSRQHHRQPARDDVFPLAADLRRDARQVPGAEDGRRACRRATCRRISGARKSRAMCGRTRNARTRRSRASNVKAGSSPTR